MNEKQFRLLPRVEKEKVVDYIAIHTPYSRAKVLDVLEPLMYSYPIRPFSLDNLVERGFVLRCVPELDVKEENGIYRMVIQANK